MTTTEAQKRAQARYDPKRPTGVLVRFHAHELRRLDWQRREGESRAALIKRVLGFAP